MMKLQCKNVREQTETVQIYSELPVPWYNRWQLILRTHMHSYTLTYSIVVFVHVHQNTSTTKRKVDHKEGYTDHQNVESEKMWRHNAN